MNNKWVIRIFVIFMGIITTGLGVAIVFPNGLSPLGYAKIVGCVVIGCILMIIFDEIVFESR